MASYLFQVLTKTLSTWRPLPGSKTDREHQSYAVDEAGDVAQRVSSPHFREQAEVQEAILAELRSIREGIELLLGGELRQ